MRPRSPGYLDEKVYVFYGINRNTFEIEEVCHTRGNMLLREGQGDQNDRRPVPEGARPHEAAALFYGLSDIVPIVVAVRDSEFSKRKIAELAEKALLMKREALPTEP